MTENSQAPEPAALPHNRAATALAAAGIVFGSLLIAAAARGDLWFDEIVSLRGAEAMRRLSDVIFGFRHDNNHILNTVWLYVCGGGRPFYLYRLPAVLFGIASLVMLFRFARRWGAAESAIVVWLAAFSLPLIQYFSEARGYAPAMFFSLLALSSTCALRDGRQGATLAALWISLVLGLLSHLLVAPVLVSLACLVVVREISRKAPGSVGRVLRALLVELGMPSAFLLALYVVFVRHMKIGGAPEKASLPAVLAQTLELVSGVPASVPAAVAVVAWLLLVAAATVSLRAAGFDEWAFFPVLLVAFPAAIFLVARPEYLFPRYFVICFPFFYLLASRLLAQLWRGRARWGPVAVVAVVIAFAASQSPLITSLLTLERGSYGAAIRDVTAAEPEGTITIGSDLNTQNRFLVEFYAEREAPRRDIRFIDVADWPRFLPEWLIVRERADGPGAAVSAGPAKYVRFRSYFSSELSGWNWHIYRRVTATAPGAIAPVR